MPYTIMDMDKRFLETYPPPLKRRRRSHCRPVGSGIQRKWTGSLPDKYIAAIVTRVSRGAIIGWVNNLSAFHTRHTLSIYIDQAAAYLRDEFLAMGYTDVDFHTYIKNGHSLKNVVCTKPGTSASGQVVVLCGHYDCIMEQHADAESRAPGADDNASGIAAMLEIARVLVDADLHDTVRFVAFSGEEQGLWGSTAYAQHLQDTGTNLRRLVNLDMIGYPPDDNAVIIEVDMGNAVAGNDAESQQLGQVMVRMAADYTGLPTVQGNIYASDYMPFESRGYVVAGVYEGGESPWYHSAGDTPDTVDYDYVSDVARFILGTLLEETLSVADESNTPVDLYIRDNSADTGDQPSDHPHWMSPDIWVRNESPDTAGEDPAAGHQPPINGVPNYLYTRIHNRGSQPAGPMTVKTFRCDPATGMIWPDNFTQIGSQRLAEPLAAGSFADAGPFIWTPHIIDHECLLAMVSCQGDHAIPDVYYGRIDHSLLVRYDNNIGQRNVSPQASIPGGKTRTCVVLRGDTMASANTLTVDADDFPGDTRIEMRVPRKVADQGAANGLIVDRQNSRWCYFLLDESFQGILAGFSLDASEQAAVTLWIDISLQAIHGHVYPLTVSQFRGDSVVGRYRIEITAVKESEDYIYGNCRSRELHTLHCPFFSIMSKANVRPFDTVRTGLLRGYNGCAFCLPKYNDS